MKIERPRCERCGSSNTYADEGSWECIDCGEIMLDERLGRPPQAGQSVWLALVENSVFQPKSTTRRNT